MQGLRLEVRQTQQLVMTPQLQQAIKLLQMSNLELEAHVAALLESNPLITTEDGTTAEPREREEADDTAPSPEGDPKAGDLSEDPSRIGDSFDVDIAGNVYDSAGPGTDVPTPTAADPAQRPLEPRSLWGTGSGDAAAMPAFEGVADTPALRDHLARQVRMMRLAEPIRATALALVEALEDDGYLREALSAVAGRLGATAEEAETALQALQRCDPVGVAARDLAECLALQLAERNRLDPMMRRLLDNLPLLQRGDRHRLCLACGAHPEDIADMLADLRGLDPRPGHRFSSEDVRLRVPDVVVKARADGGWDIALNEATLPRIAMDQTYALSLDGAGRECDRWIAERRAEAHWLLRSMAKRAETILVVSREIVRAQARFFDEGAAALRPMTLRQVAEATSLHESTVSRVASGKLIDTPRGLFEFKYFFTNAVGDDMISAESVRQKLRQLVDGEAADAILSDDDIVAALDRQGMAVARRTIAKYRKMLGIPSSVERRRLRAFA
ncbi:MAG: RNA polymerase factor sigma-54 [Pseudomonadota bacterium]